MNETFICSHCGQERPVSERIDFDGQEVCQGCYETEACICDHCGSRIWMNDDYGDSRITLCHDCGERYCERCADCSSTLTICSIWMMTMMVTARAAITA